MWRAILMVGLAVLAVHAQASKERGVYVGAGLNLISVGVVDPFDNAVNFITGDVLLGYKYNNYLGAEVRYGKSLQDESLAEIDADTGLRDSVNSQIGRYFSAYYRAELANEIAKLYVLLGQSTVDMSLDYESTGETVDISESGFSYGFGFGLWLDERMNLNFEYKAVLQTDAADFSGGSISADYRF